MVAVVGSASCRKSDHGISVSGKKPLLILTVLQYALCVLYKVLSKLTYAYFS